MGASFLKKKKKTFKVLTKCFYIYRLPQGLHGFEYIGYVVNVICCPSVVGGNDIIWKISVELM